MPPKPLPHLAIRRRMCLTFCLLVATLVTAAPVVAATLRIGGTGAALGLVRALGEGFAQAHDGATVDVPPSLGSRGGIKALLAGKLHLAVSSRPLKDAERQAGASQMLLGKTAVALVTSRTDWAASLSSEQVVAYFGLRRHDWPDGVTLHIVLRPRSETDTRVLIERIPGMKDALETAWARPEIPIAFTDQDNLDAAERLSGSLAFAALSAVITERRAVAVLPLDGVRPTPEALRDGRYPLMRPFYLVLDAAPAPLAEAFVRYAESGAGRAILRDAGTLPPTE